jgi:sec-independent protein translocase protein TatB
MFDIGWSELIIIGVVALIVIGPRDLPDLFRTLGRFTAKLRSMARDFQRAMESAADQAGVKDVAKDLKSMTSSKNLGLDAVKDAAAKFEKWDPLKPAPMPAAAKPAVTKPAVATAAAAAATPAEAAPKPEAPSVGPATEAMRAQAAERRAILDEAAQKLRATQAAPATAPEAPKGDA